MPDSSTTVLALVLPEVGASSDTWGTKLNSNFIDLDALFDTGVKLKVTKGGTGLATFTAAGAIPYSTAATTLAALAIGTARQVLQTNAGATAPQWTSNMDLPGTLDVTGAAVFDSTVEAAGNIRGTTGNGYVQLLGDSGASVTLRLTDAGLLLLGDTTNANMTIGLTLNQAGADDQIFCGKSSDVATGLTSLPNTPVETDDYFTFSKIATANGGLLIQSLGLDSLSYETTLAFHTYGGTADGTKTTAGRGLVEFRVFEHNGSNTVANITANGNVFAILARVGGATVTRMLVDEDGDLYSVTASQTFDEHDDLTLLQGYDVARRADLRAQFGQWAEEREQELIELGVLGAPISEGGLTNVTQLQRLLVGAVRQLADRLTLAESELKMLRA